MVTQLSEACIGKTTATINRRSSPSLEKSNSIAIEDDRDDSDAPYMINSGAGSRTRILASPERSYMERLQLEGSFELTMRDIKARASKLTPFWRGQELKDILLNGGNYQIANAGKEDARRVCVHPDCVGASEGIAVSVCYVTFSLVGPPYEEASACIACLTMMWGGVDPRTVLSKL